MCVFLQVVHSELALLAALAQRLAGEGAHEGAAARMQPFAQSEARSHPEARRRKLAVRFKLVPTTPFGLSQSGAFRIDGSEAHTHIGVPSYDAACGAGRRQRMVSERLAADKTKKIFRERQWHDE